MGSLDDNIIIGSIFLFHSNFAILIKIWPFNFVILLLKILLAIFAILLKYKSTVENRWFLLQCLAYDFGDYAIGFAEAMC